MWNFNSLRTVLDNVLGYHVKTSKCQLIVKDEKYLPSDYERKIKLPSDYEIVLEWSIKISSVLDTYDPLTAISEKQKFKTERTNQKRTKFLNNLSGSEKHALELASKKRSSNWLNALPQSRYNFNLKKIRNPIWN